MGIKGTGYTKFLLIITLALLPGAMAQTVAIIPATQNVNYGDTFTVNVTITGATDLYGYQWDMNYSNFSSSRITYISTASGPFLSPGATVNCINPDSTVLGYLNDASCNREGVANGVSGNGVLSNVIFRASQPGTTQLRIIDVILTNSTTSPAPLYPIPKSPAVTNNATVSVVCPDRDLDGYYNISCGGNDCNDTSNTTYPGATESCDNRDNNCNGQIDEGNITRTCGTYGVCAGISYCSAGLWGTCTGATTPPEDPLELSCDMLDNNCDGSVDNIGGGTNISSTQCQCYSATSTPGTPWSNETCHDSIDNNCNKSIDENCPVLRYFSFEAEDMTLNASVMVIDTDAAASSNRYIYPQAGSGVRACSAASPEATNLTVIPQTDVYHLWLRFNGPSTASDLLCLGFDGSYDSVYASPTGSYVWVRAEVSNGTGNYKFNLTANSHTINMGHGDELGRADKLILTNDWNFVPTGFGNTTTTGPGDLNNDRRVNVLDLVIVGKAMGSSSGGPLWDARADTDSSGGAINSIDYIAVTNNFGKTY